MDSRTVLLLLGTAALVYAKSFDCGSSSDCNRIVSAVYEKFKSTVVNNTFNVYNSTRKCLVAEGNCTHQKSASLDPFSPLPFQITNG